jgi:hypothetical protein
MTIMLSVAFFISVLSDIVPSVVMLSVVAPLQAAEISSIYLLWLGFIQIHRHLRFEKATFFYKLTPSSFHEKNVFLNGTEIF